MAGLIRQVRASGRGVRRGPRWHPPRQTKIGDLHGELAAWAALQQDVRGLEIAVHNALAMHIRQTAAELRQDLWARSQLYRRSHGIQQIVRTMLKYQINGKRRLHYSQQANHIVVRERARDLDFPRLLNRWAYVGLRMAAGSERVLPLQAPQDRRGPAYPSR